MRVDYGKRAWSVEEVYALRISDSTSGYFRVARERLDYGKRVERAGVVCIKNI